MKPFFPETGNEKQDEIYRSKMSTWMSLAIFSCIPLLYTNFLWIVNWIVLPFLFLFVFIDFMSFILFKNHVINHDETIQQSDELKQMFSKENMRKIVSATKNSYYYEVETVTNAVIVALLILLDYHISAILIAAFFLHDQFIVMPFIKKYIS